MDDNESSQVMSLAGKAKVISFNGDRSAWAGYRWQVMGLLATYGVGAQTVLLRPWNEIQGMEAPYGATADTTRVEKGTGLTASPSISSSSSSSTRTSEQAEELKMYRKARLAAQRILISTLTGSALILVQSGASHDPYEIWQKLLAEYEGTSRATTIALYQRAYTLRLSKGQSISLLLAEFDEIWHRLHGLGETNITDNQNIGRYWQHYLQNFLHSRKPSQFRRRPTHGTASRLMLHEQQSRTHIPSPRQKQRKYQELTKPWVPKERSIRSPRSRASASTATNLGTRHQNAEESVNAVNQRESAINAKIVQKAPTTTAPWLPRTAAGTTKLQPTRQESKKESATWWILGQAIT